MSWHYLQEQEVVSSEDIFWDGEQFVQSKSKTTLGEYCLLDNETESFQDSQSGMTLRRSTETPGEAELMWYQGDSLVRTYLPQEKEQEYVESDLECGPRWPESLARYDPVTSSWRTAQCSLVEGLELYSEIFPRWGIMHDGEFWEQMPLDFHITEPDCGWLPSPSGVPSKENHMIGRLDEWGGSSNPFRGHEVGKMFFPSFEEEMMGFPQGWSNLDVCEMHKFQQWQHLHGKY